MEKRGEVLVGNVVFIILNLAFLAILVLFIFRQGNGVVSYEQSYAKEIALLLDAAKPGMQITLLLDGFDEEWFKDNYIGAVKVNGNIVTVKLTEKSGYSYSFFKDVKPNIDIYPDGKLLILVEENE